MIAIGLAMPAGIKRWSGSHPAGLITSADDPVRLLAPRQSPLLVRHLARLPADDRRLRFGTPMSDALIERYVAGIDFSRDRIFGVFALDRTLIGMAHLALDPAQWFAEIGLSVEPAYREQGCGHALLQRAISHAAHSGYRTLFMHCLAENEIMKHLARKSGLKVVVAHGEASAHLALSSQLHGPRPANVFDGQTALIDSLLKPHLASSIEARTTRLHSEPTSGSTSPAPHSHADRASIKTPSRRGGLFERLDRWCSTLQRRETEAYLAKATDVYDLERRIRALERKGLHQPCG